MKLYQVVVKDIVRKRIAYIFQQYHLIPSLTVLEDVWLPLTFGWP